MLPYPNCLPLFVISTLDAVSGKSARHKKHITIDFPDAVVIGEGDIMNMD